MNSTNCPNVQGITPPFNSNLKGKKRFNKYLQKDRSGNLEITRGNHFQIEMKCPQGSFSKSQSLHIGQILELHILSLPNFWLLIIDMLQETKKKLIVYLINLSGSQTVIYSHLPVSILPMQTRDEKEWENQTRIY